MLIYVLAAHALVPDPQTVPPYPRAFQEEFGPLPFVGKYGLAPKLGKNPPTIRTAKTKDHPESTECSVAIVVAKNGKVVAATPVDCAPELTAEALKIAVDIQYEKPMVMGKKQAVWTVRTFAAGIFHKL